VVTVKKSGFTMIELLVAVAILAMLVSIAAPRYFGNMDRAREDVLRENLYILRDVIDKFHADHGRYPSNLEELVKEKYMRKVPVDPLTQSPNSWMLVPALPDGSGGVMDVHSGAPNRARDGSWYKDW
jgi:general secretion pathway protein G